MFLQVNTLEGDHCKVDGLHERLNVAHWSPDYVMSIMEPKRSGLPPLQVTTLQNLNRLDSPTWRKLS